MSKSATGTRRIKPNNLNENGLKSDEDDGYRKFPKSKQNFNAAQGSVIALGLEEISS